jgi:hypothetical protein
MAAIVHDEPLALSVSPEISAIVKRCLRKNPAERFQAMAEVKTAFEQCSFSPRERQLSIPCPSPT